MHVQYEYYLKLLYLILILSGLSTAFRGYYRFSLKFIREYFRPQGRIKHWQ